MKIIAISAHPDDIEINCAGTLAKFHKEGHSIVMCNCCSGNAGHFVIPPNELERIRLQESKNSAALIDAEHISLGYGDMSIQGGERPFDGHPSQRKARSNYHTYAGRLYVRSCSGGASCF